MQITQESAVSDIIERLRDSGLVTEEVGSYENGTIVNVTNTDGIYLYTLTVSRTPGY